MKITVNLQTLVLLSIIGVMAFFLFQGNDKELDLYKEQYEKNIKERDERFLRDSINLVSFYDSVLVRRNRKLDSANKEAEVQKKIIKFYEKKYKSIQVLPIRVIDHSLDSLFKSNGI